MSTVFIKIDYCVVTLASIYSTLSSSEFSFSFSIANLDLHDISVI